MKILYVRIINEEKGPRLLLHFWVMKVTWEIDAEKQMLFVEN